MQPTTTRALSPLTDGENDPASLHIWKEASREVGAWKWTMNLLPGLINKRHERLTMNKYDRVGSRLRITSVTVVYRHSRDA